MQQIDVFGCYSENMSCMNPLYSINTALRISWKKELKMWVNFEAIMLVCLLKVDNVHFKI